MICILHGYLLEGSGSNLWTRSIVETLCRKGKTVHLMAQENHPERYPFIVETRVYPPGGEPEVVQRAQSPYPGGCVLHRPALGEMLPVYVWDRYEQFPRVVPMVELADAEIEEYLERNVEALLRIVREQGITAIHANHSVLMSVVAQRVHAETGIPFAIMPHGSALEFAVKRDARFRRLAEAAFGAASRVFVIGDEIRERVRQALPAAEVEGKFVGLALGVDTSQFEPVPPERRPENIDGLLAALGGMPRGRTAEQSAAWMAALDRPPGESSLASALAAARDYDGKAPDADLEGKLASVDWAHDPTLLFVGRLISTKGIQGVIAALPLLLREEPRLRLVVVGHGPLREPLEAMLHALRAGDRERFFHIVDQGRELEGAPEGEAEGTELAMVARWLDQLRERGELDDYFAAARELLRPDTVIFTGYLTHRELRWLFPCCDAAIFPSVVREAGPLVFLEALASGVFPLGTYFGGMRASIDAVSDVLPPETGEAMKLSAEAEHTVEDMVRNVPLALRVGPEHRAALAARVRERYDWSNIADRLLRELEGM